MGAALHIPVLIGSVTEAMAPIEGGVFVDGTFGAGGYARALLEAGAAQVIGIDRDPDALAAARAWAAEEPRLTLVEARFSALDTIAEAEAKGPVAGVVLDIGVSSMQIDRAARGFSFRRAGPLDMRMAGEGPSAADLVNRAREEDLAAILRHLGEERAARRIARAIAAARSRAPITDTAALAEIVAGCLPPPRPGQIHPATRCFQALRIAVNDELHELVAALGAAERLLPEGGRLAVVTFHSLEDRIVKRYLRAASATGGGGSRHAPEIRAAPPRYRRPVRPVEPGAAERAANPRARSARLRSAVRTAAPAVVPAGAALGLPPVPPVRQILGGGR